ncbi:hypothetical protein [Streptomyces sp. DH37]|uniref:hypothetical protein n=1 Tax=Streptomyces sp. DH37 TaxID=3040122 RepID=UPI0024436609|nr:hypothetical protein [Streptomyces sp. DH37]MDG9700914.1 hypothetical protein [Streptomyces sp. DH37]
MDPGIGLGEFRMQQSVFGLGRVKRSDESFDVGFELPDFGSVGGTELLEFRDLYAKPPLAVGNYAARTDLGVEVVLQVGMPLSELFQSGH